MSDQNDKPTESDDKKPKEQSLADAPCSALQWERFKSPIGVDIWEAKPNTKVSFLIVQIPNKEEWQAYLRTDESTVAFPDSSWDLKAVKCCCEFLWINRDKLYPVQSESEQGTVQEKYNELIMAVESKFQGESRHETALRYIAERESNSLSATEDRNGCDHEWEVKQDSSGEVDGGPGDQWEWRECRVCGETEEPTNEYDAMVGEQKERYNP